MLDPTRSWGEATALALQYDVSRKFLYTLTARAAQGLRNALTAQPPGPKPEANILVVDDEALRQAMVVLATAVPGTVRGIQLTLELLFHHHCAVGLISQTLQDAGEQAQRYNAGIALPIPVLGEDEARAAVKAMRTVRAFMRPKLGLPLS
jgi:hypothetical protein